MQKATSTRRSVLAGLTGVVAALSGCQGLQADTGSDPAPETATDSTPDAPEDALRVTDHKMTREHEGEIDESVRVSVLVENQSDVTVARGGVRVRFFDSDGDSVAESVRHVLNVRAGEYRGVSVFPSGFGSVSRRVESYEVTAFTGGRGE